jgi:hypothetical protein
VDARGVLADGLHELHQADEAEADALGRLVVDGVVGHGKPLVERRAKNLLATYKYHRVFVRCK